MTDPLDLETALETARQAAAAADEIAMRHFGSRLEIERKADDSPVTVADRQAEQAIREVLTSRWPEHEIFGEEYGRNKHADPDAPLWLIDPIDGTRSFIRGLPFWSVQIALMVKGELLLGVSSAPAFGETAWARTGGGAFLDGHPVSIRPVDRLAEADVCFGNLRTLAQGPRWRWAAAIVAEAARCRGYGDFYSYHRLADGSQDAVIESDVNILDIAALAVIVTEAGGHFTDLEGRPPGLATTSVLAAAPELHCSLLSSLHEIDRSEAADHS